MKEGYENIEKMADHRFAEKATVVKNILLAFCMLIVLASLTGVLGYGGWTKEEAGTLPGCKVEYERFLRIGYPTPLTLYSSATQGETLKVQINRSYFNSVNFKEVVPKPFKVAINKENLVYYFLQQGKEPKKITFHSRAEKMGSSTMRLSDGADSVEINQFIYP